MTLTRAELDAATCSNPGCAHDHDDGPLYLHATCHAAAPVDTRYEHGEIVLTCGLCDREVARIAVAEAEEAEMKATQRVSDRAYQFGQEAVVERLNAFLSDPWRTLGLAKNAEAAEVKRVVTTEFDRLMGLARDFGLDTDAMLRSVPAEDKDWLHRLMFPEKHRPGPTPV